MGHARRLTSNLEVVMRIALFVAILALGSSPAWARPCSSHGYSHGQRSHAHSRTRRSHSNHAHARHSFRAHTFGSHSSHRYGNGYGRRSYRYGYTRYGRRAYFHNAWSYGSRYYRAYPRYVSYRYHRGGYYGSVRPYIRPLSLAPFVTRFTTALTLDDDAFSGAEAAGDGPGDVNYDGVPHARAKPVGSRFLVGG